MKTTVSPLLTSRNSSVVEVCSGKTSWEFITLKIPGLGSCIDTLPVEHFYSLYLAQAPIKNSSVALVRERTIPTERPPPVGEVSGTGTHTDQKEIWPLCLFGIFYSLYFAEAPIPTKNKFDHFACWEFFTVYIWQRHPYGPKRNLTTLPVRHFLQFIFGTGIHTDQNEIWPTN